MPLRAGYIPWLSRNMLNSGKMEIEKFNATSVRIHKEFVNIKLKDLVLREVIWTVAEQIRHAPQRINQLFHFFRNESQNVSWYQDLTLVDWFVRNKYTKNIYASLEDLKEPYVDVEKVKDGIEQCECFVCGCSS